MRPEDGKGPAHGKATAAARDVVDHSAELRERLVRNLARVQTMSREAARHHDEITRAAGRRADDLGEEAGALRRHLAREVPHVTAEDLDALEGTLYERHRLLSLAAARRTPSAR